MTAGRLTITALAVGAAMLPLALALLPDGADRISWIPEADPVQVGTAAVVVSGGTFAWLIVYVLASLAVARRAWILRGDDERRWPYLLLLGWAVLPVCFIYGASLVYVPVFLDRYLTIVVPALTAAVGVSIAALPRRWPIAALVLIGAVTLMPVIQLYTTERKVDWRKATFLVAQEAQPGDGVIIFRRGPDPFDHYYALAEGPEVKVYDVVEVLEADVYARILEEHDRIWLLLNGEDSKRDRSTLMAGLAGRRTIEEHAYYEMKVSLLED